MRRVLPTVVAAVFVTAATLAFGGTAHADRIRDGQWHLRSLDVAEAHRHSQGEGITVAVIDTGINAQHTDLTGNVLRGFDIQPGGSGNGWGDTDGHGTAMAGLIAAHGHGPDHRNGALGIAPKARILPIRLRINGKQISAGPQMAQAVNGAVDRGAKIISISQRTTSDGGAYEAIQRAINAGVIVVASAGNRPAEEFIGDPAAYPGVVAVGAVGRDGKVADVSVRGRALMLAAPGVDIVSTGATGRYRIGTGTSPSTAIVSGVAALVWSRYPHLTDAQVVEHLTDTADDAGGSGRDEEYGHGVVNPAKALTATPDVAQSSAPPTNEGNELPPRTSPRAVRPKGRSNAGLFVLAGAGSGVALVVVLVGFIAARRQRHRHQR